MRLTGRGAAGRERMQADAGKPEAIEMCESLRASANGMGRDA
jgi:hypothetical protein